MAPRQSAQNAETPAQKKLLTAFRVGTNYPNLFARIARQKTFHELNSAWGVGKYDNSHVIPLLLVISKGVALSPLHIDRAYRHTEF